MATTAATDEQPSEIVAVHPVSRRWAHRSKAAWAGGGGKHNAKAPPVGVSLPQIFSDFPEATPSPFLVGCPRLKSGKPGRQPRKDALPAPWPEGRWRFGQGQGRKARAFFSALRPGLGQRSGRAARSRCTSRAGRCRRAAVGRGSGPGPNQFRGAANHPTGFVSAVIRAIALPHYKSKHKNGEPGTLGHHPNKRPFFGAARARERKTTGSPPGYQKRADGPHQVRFSGHKEPLTGEAGKSDAPSWPGRAFLENGFDSV